MTFSETATNMALDINVVQQRTPESIFFYSQYVISVVNATADESAPTILDVAFENELLVGELVVTAGLDATLSDPTQTLTLFVPTNEAFAALPSRVVDYISSDARILYFILRGHVATSILTSAALAGLDGQDLSLLSGPPQRVRVVGDDVVVVFGQVVQVDIEASDGVIHLVDRILTIPSVSELLVGDITEFGTLLTLLATSGIDVESLSDISVFIPREVAFTEFETAYGDLLSFIREDPNWRLHLQSLLLSHIFPAIALSNDFVSGQTITMLSGEEFTVEVGNQGIGIAPSTGQDGVAPIVGLNLYTTQGVAHVLNQVLLPFFMTTTVVDVAATSFPTFFRLMEQANLVDLLDTTLGITVFAPSKKAFAALDASTLNFLESRQGRDTLADTLSYHVLPEVISAASLAEYDVISTLLGPNITVTASTGTVLINGATVLESDQLVRNGIVHMIDTVLEFPVDTTAPTSAPTATNTTAPTMAPTLTPTNATDCTSAPTTKMNYRIFHNLSTT
eukprot:scaffold3199_cov165-Amphora_coffeaeformis.AAC.16